MQKVINFMIFFFRFEEECTTIEEEDCRTVYDDAWENKCELVNVTLPATNCREITKIEMETKYLPYILFFQLLLLLFFKRILDFRPLILIFHLPLFTNSFFLLFISNETS